MSCMHIVAPISFCMPTRFFLSPPRFLSLYKHIETCPWIYYHIVFLVLLYSIWFISGISGIGHRPPPLFYFNLGFPFPFCFFCCFFKVPDSNWGSNYMLSAIGHMGSVFVWGCSHADVGFIRFGGGEWEDEFFLCLRLVRNFSFWYGIVLLVLWFEMWGFMIDFAWICLIWVGERVGLLGFWSWWVLGLGFWRNCWVFGTGFARNGVEELHEWGVPSNDVVGFEKRLDLEIRWIC